MPALSVGWRSAGFQQQLSSSSFYADGSIIEKGQNRQNRRPIGDCRLRAWKSRIPRCRWNRCRRRPRRRRARRRRAARTRRSPHQALRRLSGPRALPRCNAPRPDVSAWPRAVRAARLAHVEPVAPLVRNQRARLRRWQLLTRGGRRPQCSYSGRCALSLCLTLLSSLSGHALTRALRRSSSSSSSRSSSRRSSSRCSGSSSRCSWWSRRAGDELRPRNRNEKGSSHGWRRQRSACMHGRRP